MKGEVARRGRRVERVPAATVVASLPVVVALVLPADVAAQRAAEPDSLTETPSDPSPALAGVLSLATTAAPIVAGSMLDDEVGLALVGAGLLFGPLSGYAYGDVIDRGVGGLGFRSAVAAGGTIAIFALCQAGDCNPFRDNPGDGDLSTATFGVVILGGGLLIGSAAIDVLSAPDHVKSANEARADAAGTTEARIPSSLELSVYPVVAAGGWNGGVGLGATLRF